MFECENCGEIDKIIIDGYNVSGRLLEGVRFHCWIDAEGFWQAEVDPRDASYFQQFNTEYWYLQVTECASEDDYGMCPQCHEEIYY